ncbi:hypothetical protein [Streptomyces antimicrobicus]|uniref:Uncharacterized protein n=1 Tax=Streptomyces antimicrobicus TaxID=2883108 RepID=A0ABS8B013_9ACTN|nr:hypothetical protein [Streptomyces antimicrobicus]MCB5177919.1 hypothetical protein [Streptomyces antimicrobicus]
MLSAFVLQLLVSWFAFGGRDVVAATLMARFSGLWLASALNAVLELPGASRVHTDTEYDGAGRVTAVIAKRFGDETKRTTTLHTDYEELGRKTAPPAHRGRPLHLRPGRQPDRALDVVRAGRRAHHRHPGPAPGRTAPRHRGLDRPEPRLLGRTIEDPVTLRAVRRVSLGQTGEVSFTKAEFAAEAQLQISAGQGPRLTPGTAGDGTQWSVTSLRSDLVRLIQR